MGSIRPRRGGSRGRGRGVSRGRGRPGRGRGESSGGDFRWKRDRLGGKRDRPDLHESGDAIPNDETPGALMFVESGAPLSAAQPVKTEADKKQAMRERQRSAKRRRREMHDAERVAADEMLRDAPEAFLWARFVEWGSGKLTGVEKKAEKWTKEQVFSVEEVEGTRLIDQVKEVVGPDYVAQGEWKKKKASAVAGVACVALACSAVRAVYLAKSMYDGKPVGKLFSKHIQIREQKEWLAGCCKSGLAPSAAGTAKRVQRLIEEGDLTLAHTSALVIDFSRDVRDRNILDLNTMREELFDLINTHARPLIAEGKMKVVLYYGRREKVCDA